MYSRAVTLAAVIAGLELAAACLAASLPSHRAGATSAAMATPQPTRSLANAHDTTGTRPTTRSRQPAATVEKAVAAATSVVPTVGASVIQTARGTPSATTPTTTGSAAGASVAAPALTVTCGTDLPLAESPDTPYNFLCQAGGVPVTWASDRITIFVSGLTPAQAAVFPLALSQWEAAGHFVAVPTGQQSAADLTVSGVNLTAGQPGYTEDGYTRVAWSCSPSCHFVGASVQLAAGANLDAAGWMSTILHELGHVAGLNHVSRAGEVMYPVLSANPPVVYSAGDLAGMAVLAAQRDA